MFRKLGKAAAFTASAVAGYYYVTYKMGEAWDNGYIAGRTAEREDWNWPTGMQPTYLDVSERG